MKKTLVTVLLLLTMASLSGCSMNTWSFCVNDVYATRYASPRDGVKIVSGLGEWIVVDVSITNLTNKPQLLDEAQNQFFLADLSSGQLYPNSAFTESSYGIQWRVPVLPRETIRAEVYFETPIGLLESSPLGIMMTDGALAVPETAGFGSAEGMLAGRSIIWREGWK